MEANLSPSKKRKQLVLDLVATLIVLLLALLVVLPIWWIFRSSLMSTAKLNEYPPSFIPHEWLWANYSKAWRPSNTGDISGILSPSSFRPLLLVR